jgi:hypothetical protein
MSKYKVTIKISNTYTYETNDEPYEEQAIAEALQYEYMWQADPSGKEYDIKVKAVDE